MTSTEKWDAIVVGAGLGGLTAAAYLTAAGRRTLLLEQYDVVGGCSHVFRRKRKWEFEVGVHYLGDCEPEGQIPTMLRGLGLDDRIEFLPMDPDGFDTLCYPDVTLRVPRGWDNYLANVIDAFPGEERAIRRYLGIMRRLGEAMDRSATPASLGGMAAFAARGRLASAWALVPLNRLLAACGLSERARAALVGAVRQLRVSAVAHPGRAARRVPAQLHQGRRLLPQGRRAGVRRAHDRPDPHARRRRAHPRAGRADPRRRRPRHRRAAARRRGAVRAGRRLQRRHQADLSGHGRARAPERADGPARRRLADDAAVRERVPGAGHRPGRPDAEHEPVQHADLGQPRPAVDRHRAGHRIARAGRPGTRSCAAGSAPTCTPRPSRTPDGHYAPDRATPRSR